MGYIPNITTTLRHVTFAHIARMVHKDLLSLILTKTARKGDVVCWAVDRLSISQVGDNTSYTSIRGAMCLDHRDFDASHSLTPPGSDKRLTRHSIPT